MNAIEARVSNAKRINDLLALIDELIKATAEENVILARNLPATRPAQLMRKTQLANLFEKWVTEIKEDKIDLKAFDEATRLKLADRSKELQATMNKNMMMLRAAIEASQRRIEAVMLAIRGNIAESSPYASNGRVGAVPVSYSPSIQV